MNKKTSLNKLIIESLSNKTSTVLSVVFAFLSLIGWIFHSFPENDVYFVHDYKYLFIFLVLIGFLLLYKFLISAFVFIFKLLKTKDTTPCKKNRISYFLFEQHTFVKMLVVSLFVYGVWWFAFFPGTLHPDMTHHLYQSLGIQALSKMAPIVLTKVVGVVMTIAKNVFHYDNAGVIIYVFGLYVLQSITVGYMFSLFKKMSIPYLLRWFAFVYVFIIPVFSIWVIDFGKDTPYYIFTLLFILSMADTVVLSSKKEKCYRQLVLMILASAGMAFCRNNGAPIVITSMIAAIIFIKENRLKYIATCVASMIIIFGINLFISGHYEVGNAPKGERLCVPIQVYFSYIKENPSEITEDENEMIREMFGCEKEELVNSFDPMIADPIKNRFKANPTDEQMDRFWEFYRNDLKKHPAAFLRGAIRHVYGYFYPGIDCYANRTAIYSLSFHTEYFDFDYIWVDSPIRKAMENVAEGIYKFPITNILYRTGVQMYIMLSLAAFVLTSKRKRNICALIPSVLMIFIVISPVNAYFRYMLPVFVSLPFNLTWTFYSNAE